MFKLPSLSLTLLLLTTQTPSHADLITTARTRYAAINRDLKRYWRVERDLMGLSLEGGKLTAYYEKAQPRKLQARFYGESGQNVEEYYFWKGQLFFFYKVEQGYGDILGSPSKVAGKVVNQSETRAYFENGKLVRLLADKTSQSLSTPAAKRLAADVKTNIRFYLDAASKPNTQAERKLP